MKEELLDFLKVWGIIFGGLIVVIAIMWGVIALLTVAPIVGVVLVLLAFAGILAWGYVS